MSPKVPRRIQVCYTILSSKSLMLTSMTLTFVSQIICFVMNNYGNIKLAVKKKLRR